jgi:hypothetical protein
MKTTRKWIYTLTAALGCAVSSPAFGGEFTEPVFRPPLINQASAISQTANPASGVQQVSAQSAVPQATTPAAAPQQVPTSRWDTQEPIQTPEQPTQPMAAMTPGSCASYDAGCCYPGCQFIVGVEATFFFPQFSRNFLNNNFTNGLGTVNIVDNAALGSADGSLLVGPRVSLGIQGEVWGLVGRYWNSANWGHNFTPAIPDSTQSGIQLFDTFNLYTVDLELQRRFCWRNWDMYGFGGFRYASVNNDRLLWSQNTFGTDIVNQSASSVQQFNGAGVTFGVFGLRPLFCDDGALKAYFTNRYSILWGNGLAGVQTSARAAIDGGASFSSLDGALAGGDGDLFIAEVGAGLQWEACLCCLPGRAFFRAGVEWQYWDANAGVNASANSFANSGSASSNAFAQAGDLMFDLVGFTIGAGLTY